MTVIPITHPKIAVFGLYKTGTTALFSNINNSMFVCPRLLSEPKDFIGHRSDNETGVLAKVIVGESDVNYDSFTSFDKKILIIRDPRDWIISSCIFVLQQEKKIYTDDLVTFKILSLLRKKESDPTQISFKTILEEVLVHTSLGTLEGFIQWVQKLHLEFMSFDEKMINGIRIFYEDFIDRKLDGLSAYLNFEVNENLALDEIFAHVPRSKTYDNWKNWFTDEDVKFFKPLFEGMLEKYNYNQSWEINKTQCILKKNCSEYVEKVIQLKRAHQQ